MKVRRIVGFAILSLVSPVLPTSSRQVTAQRLGVPAVCTAVTEEEWKRRYPTNITYNPESIFVVGSIGKPGMIHYQQGMTLTQVVEMVGGVLPDANSRVRILHIKPGKPEQPAVEINLVRIKAGQEGDALLEGGDVVEIESRCQAPMPPHSHSYPDFDPPARPKNREKGVDDVAGGAHNKGLQRTRTTEPLIREDAPGR